MYKLFLLLIISQAAFTQEYWDYVPNVHNFVHDIYIPESDPNTIIVAADSIPIEHDFKDLFPSYYSLLKGTGLCISRDGGESFTEFPEIDSSLVLSVRSSSQNPNLLVASISNQNTGQFAFSEDLGKTWKTDENDCSGTPKIMDMIALEDRMLAGAVSTGRGFFYSFDNFLKCENSDTLNVSVRDIDLQDGIVWLSSDNNAQSGVYRSETLGNSWEKDASGLDGFRVHCVDASGVYQKWGVAHCGVDRSTQEGYVGEGIYITRNNGLDWSFNGAEGCKVYDIEHHPKYPLFMAAACGKDGIYFSSNGGVTWEKQFNEGLPTEADVRIIYIPNLDIVDNGFQVYAGVYNEGLFRSKNIMPELTSVEDNYTELEFDIISTYPNPASNNVSINVSALNSGEYNIQLVSMTGQIHIDITENFKQGLNTIDFKIDKSINNGMYLLNISNDKYNQSTNLIIDHSL